MKWTHSYLVGVGLCEEIQSHQLGSIGISMQRSKKKDLRNVNERKGTKGRRQRGSQQEVGRNQRPRGQSSGGSTPDCRKHISMILRTKWRNLCLIFVLISLHSLPTVTQLTSLHHSLVGFLYLQLCPFLFPSLHAKPCILIEENPRVADKMLIEVVSLLVENIRQSL